MKSEITFEKIKEVAERYGLKVTRTDDKEKAGLFVGDKEIDINDLFPDLKNK